MHISISYVMIIEIYLKILFIYVNHTVFIAQVNLYWKYINTEEFSDTFDQYLYGP